jgi:hypothetical protein
VSAYTKYLSSLIIGVGTCGIFKAECLQKKKKAAETLHGILLSLSLSLSLYIYIYIYIYKEVRKTAFISKDFLKIETAPKIRPAVLELYQRTELRTRLEIER